MVVDADGVSAEDVQVWTQGLEEISARLSPHFARRDAHQRATQYLRALLSPVERKNGWQLAEIAGERTPYGMQHLLGRAVWDAEAVCDDLQGYVVAHLGDAAGMLILDETSVPKKGTKSAGVSRQYCGSLGKRENCQVGVLLAYAGPAGCAFIDRALYLPKAWTEDPERGGRPGSPRRCRLPPSRRSADSCWSEHWMAGCRPGGCWPTRSTGETPGCAPVWRTATAATSWAWRPTSPSGSGGSSSGSTR